MYPGSLVVIGGILTSVLQGAFQKLAVLQLQTILRPLPMGLLPLLIQVLRWLMQLFLTARQPKISVRRLWSIGSK